MEDTLRGVQFVLLLILLEVLILVLMEDTLRVKEEINKGKITSVLILVLMEDTLRGFRGGGKSTLLWCLNPCFNGRYSQRSTLLDLLQLFLCLNPCFNGRYSQSIIRADGSVCQA